MGLIFDIFVADENDSQEIWEEPDFSRSIQTGVDDYKLFVLLSLTRKKRAPKSFGKNFFKEFKLLWPEDPDDGFVVKFPDDFVRALSTLKDRSLESLAMEWIKRDSVLKFGLEPDAESVDDLGKGAIAALKQLRSVSKKAITKGKAVLFRLSL